MAISNKHLQAMLGNQVVASDGTLNVNVAADDSVINTAIEKQVDALLEFLDVDNYVLIECTTNGQKFVGTATEGFAIWSKWRNTFGKQNVTKKPITKETAKILYGK